MKVTATATRTEGWWVVEVPEVDGAFTQARRLEGIPHMVKDAVSLLEDIPYDSIEVSVQPVLGDNMDRIVKDTRKEMDEAACAYEAAAEQARETVHLLREQGLSVRDVGKIMGISYQRVSQLDKRNLQSA